MGDGRSLKIKIYEMIINDSGISQKRYKVNFFRPCLGSFAGEMNLP
jgi:hypothetical protein